MRPPEASAPWWPSESGSLRHTWIDDSSNEPSRSPTKARRLDHEPYVPPWIAVRCGEGGGWRIPILFWDTRGNQVMRVVADRALAGAARRGERSGSRDGLWNQPEGRAGSGLGSSRSARRGFRSGLEGIASSGNLGADLAPGRRGPGSACGGNCEAG